MDQLDQLEFAGFQLEFLGAQGDQLEPVVLASTVTRAALEKKNLLLLSLWRVESLGAFHARVSLTGLTLGPGALSWKSNLKS